MIKTLWPHTHHETLVSKGENNTIISCVRPEFGEDEVFTVEHSPAIYRKALLKEAKTKEEERDENTN